MANVSKISDGITTYNICDASARNELSGKQDILISGTTIKTINNESILGSGNINIAGGSGTQSDWNVSDTSSMAFIKNKPTIPNSVSDLSDASDYITVNDMVNTTLISLADVATTGEYSDLLNKPTIPAAQVQSDWNATSGMGVILNKPTLANVAITGDYNDLVNKPTIPVVGSGILTITQGGNVKGTFSANELSNTTIDLDSGVTGNYVTLDTAQTITGVKTFEGNKVISFKQTRTTDKPGFTIYTSGLKELATFEFRPNTINSYPLLYLGQWKTDADSVVQPLYVGFRLYDNSISDPAAYNLLAPLARDARNDFNLTGTHQHFYLPLGFKNGSTMVTTTSNGVVDLSTLMPSSSVDQTYNASSTNAQSGVAIEGMITTKFQVVDELPANPQSGVFYFIKEPQS